ncbi:MAG: DUF3048 domain-containing protein [Trueperaceae bacterium]
MAVRPRGRAAVRSRRRPAWWADADRRRAALLSITLHVVVIFLAIRAFTFVPAEPPPTYLVIDLGAPQEAEVARPAPAADEVAPDAPEPQVADTQVGEPVTAVTPEPQPVAPAPAPQTQQPESPAAAPAAPEEATVEAPRPPLPAPMTPVATTPEVPVASAPATPLPTIDLPEIEPTPLAERVPVPLPTVAALLPEPRAIAAQPQVSVAAPAEVPVPRVGVEVEAAAPVPVPRVGVEVEAAAPVPLPSPLVATAPARPVAVPDVRADVAAARDVRVAPQVAVATPVAVPLPRVQATVAPLPAAPVAPEVEAGAAAAASEVPSQRDEDLAAGGDAANPGQPDGAVDDPSPALGLAAGPDPEELPPGARALPFEPFARQLERPLAVLVDNVGGVPVSGIRPASLVFELPVEAGLTRLMLVFDRSDPGRVGPVRSARAYFVELADRLDAVLVHDGGSPGALAAIAAGPTRTLNAFTSGDLFSRGDGRAPYNLYSAGDALRAAVNRLDLARGRTISGTIYRPSEEADEVVEVVVGFGGGYVTGFRYEAGFNAYRWLRDGAAAVDAAGEAVVVDAVLIGEVEARPFPNDPEGRLSVPLRGGQATLYLNGRALTGRWELRDATGVFFVGDGGEVVDLAPFKTWVALTPAYGERGESR